MPLCEITSTVGTWTDELGTYRFILDARLEPAQMKTDIHLQPVLDGAVEVGFAGATYFRPTGQGWGWREYSGGQNVEEMRKVTDFAQGWTTELRDQVADVWDRWHMNGARAGCVHQIEERWAERPIDPSKPTNTYGKHFPEQKLDSWNMLVWIPRGEHPEGLLSFRCSKCEYRYGSQWLHEMLPDDVAELVRSLPHAD